MEYFNLLEFKKEPFSNSPQPEFLFASPQQNACLQKLELAVRLKRGLNIVIGAVGTGKTTLCRKLIQNLSSPAAGKEPDIKTFLLLDPAVESQLDFLQTVACVLEIPHVSAGDNERQIKEKIKTFLFEQGVDEQKNIVLVIDEGQKIPGDCLEILREFLNYETNHYKLLQIVIFAQPEFRQTLAARANLLDRVNYLYRLKPLSFLQTKAMIESRISAASLDAARADLFTPGGFLAVYLATAGYPRKVVSLCHQAMLMMIIRSKKRAGWFLVGSCASKMTGQGVRRAAWAAPALIIVFAAAMALAAASWMEPRRSDLAVNEQRVFSGIDLNKEKILQVFSGKGRFEKSADMTGDETPGKMPDRLGAITLKKRMTIWRMFENIYGDSGKDIRTRFMEANPGIKNLNATVRGTVVYVPAAPVQNHPAKDSAVLVSVQEGRDLDAVYGAFVEKIGQKNMPSLIFISTWHRKTGKKFAIVLDKRFRTVDEAEDGIRQLPRDLSVSAKVLSGWEEGTLFFNRREIGS